MPYTIFSNVDVGNDLVNKSARLFEKRICSSLDVPFIISLKTLSRKNPVRQKLIIKEKEYSALQVHITIPKMNNLDHVAC